MTRAATQLVFDLPFRPAMGREDFLIADSNADAIALIDRWPHWQEPVQGLIGPPACGKSHLVAVWAMQSKAQVIDAETLRHKGAGQKVSGQKENGQGANGQADSISELIASLIPASAPTPASLSTSSPPPASIPTPALAIDGLEHLPPEGEEVLLHLINHARQYSISLLLSAAVPLARLDIALPDLRSRLAIVISTQMHPPCDSLMAAILVKLFTDRQLHIDDKIVHYLLPRVERSFACLNAVVEAVDKAALVHRRAITVPFVSDVYEKMQIADSG